MSQAGAVSGTIGPIGPNVETLTGNDGITVGANSSGNINVVGNNNALNGFATYVTGNAGTSTETVNSFGLSKWVVNKTAGLGTHTTIQAAINSASSGDTIFITPGTYSENLTMKGGISLCSFSYENNQVIFNGTINFSATGYSQFTGIFMENASGYVLNATGSLVGGLTFIDCFFQMSGNDLININNPNYLIIFIECQGNLASNNKLFNVTNISSGSSKYGFQFYTCFFENATGTPTTTASTIAAGQLRLSNSQINCPITSSGTSNVILQDSIIDTSSINTTALTIGGSGTNNIFNSIIRSGSASSVSVSSTANLSNMTIDSTNTNAITGAGTLVFGELDFINTSKGINTTTLTKRTTSTGSIQIYGGLIESYVSQSASYNVKTTDCIIGVVTSGGAYMMTMPNSGLSSGQRWTIKDESGSAASNNITISGNGANIDGSSTYVMNNNYGSVDIYWNGSNFFIV